MEQVLAEHPSIQVVIDLHRDGVPEDRHLVTKINGKDTAQIMFFNGLSYTAEGGAVSYLPNPYIQDNLAFSFQMEYQAAMYYPELSRGIYLASLRTIFTCGQGRCFWRQGPRLIPSRKSKMPWNPLQISLAGYCPGKHKKWKRQWKTAFSCVIIRN